MQQFRIFHLKYLFFLQAEIQENQDLKKNLSEEK